MTILFHHEPPSGAPIVCDFSGAPDTPEERLAEYGRLFRSGPVGRQRTATGVVLTFAGTGKAPWVADLAAREAACCPFMAYRVTLDHGSVRWETSGAAEVQPILDQYYALYDAAVTTSVDDLISRLGERGFVVNLTTPARRDEPPSGQPA